MKRVQIFIALVLTTIGAPALFAQTPAEIEPNGSQVAGLLGAKTESTRAGVPDSAVNSYSRVTEALRASDQPSLPPQTETQPDTLRPRTVPQGSLE